VSLLEVVAAFLLVLGSFLVIRAIMLADVAGREPGTDARSQEALPPRRHAA
jgi:hypothetical protein